MEAAPAAVPVGFRFVDDASAVTRNLLPSARITSGYRPPNHPLSRKNPNSYHTRTRAAVDMAPIPGMTFDQVADLYRKNGYNVHPDSRDEVKNPSSHATGPHWHYVLGRAR